MRSSNLSLRPDKYLPAPCVSRKQGSPAKSTHPETGTLPTTSSFAPGPCSRYRRCRWIGRITFDIYLFLGCQAGYSVKSGVNIKIDEKMVQIVNMPEDQLLFDLALGLFVDNKVSLGQGAQNHRMVSFSFKGNWPPADSTALRDRGISSDLVESFSSP